MSLKVLWHSTVPWGGSSYSVLTARTVPDIARAGHSVAVSSWYGLQGAPQSWPIRSKNDPKGKPVSIVQILPNASGNDYGVATLAETYQWMGADVCIACMDVWVIPPQVTQRMCFAPWLPVDHDPAPAGVVESLRFASYPMVYSQWGVEVLAKSGITAHYVPCSADSMTFLPMDRKAARERLGIPEDVFLVSMVSANKDPGDRKGFGEAMAGFAKFAARHDDARMYIHTLWGGPIRIDHLSERCGVADRVIQPHQFGYVMGLFDEAYMRAVYAASDVLLNTAKSEGFGLPIVEAQMCGCPVAISDFSTSRELLSAGWLIGGQQNWSMGADSFRLAVSIDAVADALDAAYSERGNEVLRKQARKGVLKFDTGKVFEKHWKPALGAIEEMVGKKSGLQLVQF